MAQPNLETIPPQPPPPPPPDSIDILQPPRLTPQPKQQTDTLLLQRTISDIISYDLTTIKTTTTDLDDIPETTIEDAKCECCGMCEECTPEYVYKIRESFSGKMVCGLCAEAVKEETHKNGGYRDKALEEHVQACVRFNSIGTAYPFLYQATAVKEILKKTKRSTFFTTTMTTNNNRGIARSSSCIPAIGEGI